jgi:hypothetical protein
LVGVEAVLFLAHEPLLQFVVALFLGLVCEESSVLLLVEGGLLLAEHVADEAVADLFGVGFGLFVLLVVEQFELFL